MYVQSFAIGILDPGDEDAGVVEDLVHRLAGNAAVAELEQVLRGRIRILHDEIVIEHDDCRGEQLESGKRRRGHLCYLVLAKFALERRHVLLVQANRLLELAQAIGMERGRAVLAGAPDLALRKRALRVREQSFFRRELGLENAAATLIALLLGVAVHAREVRGCRRLAALRFGLCGLAGAGSR